MSDISNNEQIVNDDSVIKLDFKLVRDGSGYTKNEYKIIKKYLEEGRFKDAIEKIYEYAAEKELCYGKYIHGPQDMVKILSKYAFEKSERFIVYTIDNSHKIIGEYVASIGTINRAIIDPREIFKNGIKDNAACIFIVHNHPSGNMEFSREDYDVTDRIKKAGDILGIELLDHFIVGYNENTKNIFVRSAQENEIYYTTVGNSKNKEVDNER